MGSVESDRALPAIARLRPAFCVECEAAAVEPGKPLGVVGHGIRTRRVVGPLEPAGAPCECDIFVQRFLCRHCGAVMTVVPRELLPRRHYSGPAMAMALALFGVMGESDAAVETRIAPPRRTGRNGGCRFRSIRRWCREVRTRRLFPQTRAPPASWRNRQVAERTAMTLISSCPPRHRGEKLEHQAWYGAVHALMGAAS